MSRLSAARELDVPESWLRWLEREGFVLRFRETSVDSYMARVKLILSARGGGLSVQKIRAGLLSAVDVPDGRLNV